MLLPHEERVCLSIRNISFVFFLAIIYYNLRYGFATTFEHNLAWQLAIYVLFGNVSSGISLHNICSIIIHHDFHTNAESAHALAFQKSRIYSRSSKPNPSRSNMLKDFLSFTMFYYHLFRNSIEIPRKLHERRFANLAHHAMCVFTHGISTDLIR
jgi:hypothetical protein